MLAITRIALCLLGWWVVYDVAELILQGLLPLQRPASDVPTQMFPLLFISWPGYPRSTPASIQATYWLNVVLEPARPVRFSLFPIAYGCSLEAATEG